MSRLDPSPRQRDPLAAALEGERRRPRSLSRYVKAKCLHQSVEFEIPVMPLTVDKECRRSIHAASHSSREVVANPFGKQAVVKSLLQRARIQAKLTSQPREQFPAESVLVLKEQVMHRPEFPLCCRELRSFGRGFGPWVSLLKREIPEYKTKPIPKVFLHGFHDWISAAAVRALVVSVLHKRYQCVRFSLRVIFRTDGNS